MPETCAIARVSDACPPIRSLPCGERAVWRHTGPAAGSAGFNITVFVLDFGLVQVRSGSAWWYRRYAHEQAPEDRERYESAEQEARGLRLGLWAEPKPVAPWESGGGGSGTTC